MTTPLSASTPAWAALGTQALRNGWDDYDIDSRTPDAAGLLAEFQRRSDDARARGDQQHAVIAYADHPLAVADVFRPSHGPVRGAVVFVHGGYWKGKGRPNRAFLAPAWVDAGVQWVNLGYPVAPDTSMPDMAGMVTQALDAVASSAPPFAMVEAPIVLAGNSAGAHLVAQALPDVMSGASHGRIAGCMLLSGLYDLHPLLDTAAQEWMQLTADDATRLSPLHQRVPALKAPVMVAVGADEPDAFIAQSRAYAQHLLGHVDVAYEEVFGLNHLTMIAALDSPDARLGSIMAQWLGLKPPAAC